MPVNNFQIRIGAMKYLTDSVTAMQTVREGNRRDDVKRFSPVVDFLSTFYDNTPVMDYDVEILKEGYSLLSRDRRSMVANGTSTLVRGPGFNVIVDTLTPWDKDYLIDSLARHKLSCEDINYVVCTHGHSDHIGNLNLFQRATHIVGTSISNGDVYQLEGFRQNNPHRIASNIEAIPTPGHTMSDVSVVVKTAKYGTVIIAGDLFERESDIDDPSLWKETAGSENPGLQLQNRQLVLQMADFIIPGHGPMFKVTETHREKHTQLFEKEKRPEEPLDGI